MEAFSDAELEEVNAIWRSLPEDHVWCGWASVGQPVSEIFIYRARAHWRRFLLTKAEGRFHLSDEAGRAVAKDESLTGLLQKVEAIPGLKLRHSRDEGLTRFRG